MNFIDDTLYLGSDDEQGAKLEQQVGTHFNVEFKGTAHWYLACRITREGFDVIIYQS